MRARPWFVLLALAVVGSLALAACGSSTPAAGPTTSTSTRPTSTPSPAAVRVVSEHSDYGTVLATGDGRTLYLLTADTPTVSICTTPVCSAVWPPLTVAGPPGIGAGADPTLVGELVRPDGSHQVTYDGHPLYTYSGDSGPGQTNGEGITSFGGTWYVVSASAGQPVKSRVSGASATSTTTTSSGGAGYGY